MITNDFHASDNTNKETTILRTKNKKYCASLFIML